MYRKGLNFPGNCFKKCQRIGIQYRIKVLEEQNNTLRQENQLEKNNLGYLQKKLHVIEWKIYPRNKKEVSRGFITCYKLQ